MYFGGVDCTYSQAHNQLCGEYDVKGVPTIRTFAATKRGKRETPGFYEGAREMRPIISYATAMLPQENVHAVSDATHDRFLRIRPTKAHALLFTSKTETAAMYKALALEYDKKLLFGEVRRTKLSAAVVSRYKVDTFPTLLVVPAGGGPASKHTGRLSHISLSFFLDKFVQQHDEV